MQNIICNISEFIVLISLGRFDFVLSLITTERKQRKHVLFNDVLNIFLVWLYSIWLRITFILQYGYMVKDHRLEIMTKGKPL